MSLSQYAKHMNITYKTAYRWYKAGLLDAYQLATGTIIVREPQAVPTASKIALYARVSSASQKDDLARQLERLRDYAAAKGYPVAKEVVELASGLNDSRPKLAKLLTDITISTIITSMSARLSGRRNPKRRAQTIQQYLTQNTA